MIHLLSEMPVSVSCLCLRRSASSLCWSEPYRFPNRNFGSELFRTLHSPELDRQSKTVSRFREGNKVLETTTWWADVSSLGKQFPTSRPNRITAPSGGISPRGISPQNDAVFGFNQRIVDVRCRPHGNGRHNYYMEQNKLTSGFSEVFIEGMIDVVTMHTQFTWNNKGCSKTTMVLWLYRETATLSAGI